MNELQVQTLREFGEEWSDLTKKAWAISDRKSQIRETTELIFRCIVPTLNEELKAKGCPYWFSQDQHAGYLVDGDLSFSLYPCATDEWAEQDEHCGWVDVDRAEEIKKTVHECPVIKEFCEAFPGVSIRVEYNYCGYFKFMERNAAHDEGYPEEGDYNDDDDPFPFITDESDH